MNRGSKIGFPTPPRPAPHRCHDSRHKYIAL